VAHFCLAILVDGGGFFDQRPLELGCTSSTRAVGAIYIFLFGVALLFMGRYVVAWIDMTRMPILGQKMGMIKSKYLIVKLF